MKILTLTKRNIKLFFKDKGMFFTSLITPVILLVLYATFLAGIYRDTFVASFPPGMAVPDAIIDGCVAGQLISSLLAVSCVTVAFCSNFVMVQDKASGTLKDFTVAPVRPHELALGYYLAALLSSLAVCFAALAVCLAYVACVGWYMSFADVLLLALDVFLLVMFGTALSSVINFFLSSQGQISAVGAVISAGYGFICGAYIPISQFSAGLRGVISFLPGTYGTALARGHSMNGLFNEMLAEGVPQQVVDGIMDAIDCNIYFFGDKVPVSVQYVVLAAAVAALIALYVLLNAVKNRKKTR